MEKVAKLVKEHTIVESRAGGDTIKLWEGYREQALLWRAIALVQIPATALAIVLAILLWSTRTTVLNVPPKPLPGVYTAQEIPDSEFIDFATNYINLIATYQPAVAERQYVEARKMLWEPMVAKFDVEMLGTELKAIQSTSRTQIFFVDPTKTKLVRQGRSVDVVLTGERTKMIAGKELTPVITAFTVSMSTVPKNVTNPYGVVITNIQYENLKR